MSFWKVSTFVLVALLCATVAYEEVPTAIAEGQPHMKTALGHLRKAKSQLEKASADKGGHRKKAIDLVTEAISETQKGVEFDNTH
jgi:hypothetical protein